MAITERQLDAAVRREPDHVEEASTVGLEPGHWPTDLIYGNVKYTKVCARLDGEREIVAMVYLSIDTNDVLHVLND